MLEQLRSDYFLFLSSNSKDLLFSLFFFLKRTFLPLRTTWQVWMLSLTLRAFCVKYPEHAYTGIIFYIPALGLFFLHLILPPSPLRALRASFPVQAGEVVMQKGKMFWAG